MKLFSFRSKKTEKSASVKEIVCAISGMHCISCALNIDGVLEELPGVVSASTNYAHASVSVRFDPDIISPNDLIQAIKTAGYSAKIKVNG